MNDTLLPLDEAYNSGKRSRANSFGARSDCGVLSAQPHQLGDDNMGRQLLNDNYNSSSTLNLPPKQASHHSRHSSFSIASANGSPLVQPFEIADSPGYLDSDLIEQLGVDLEGAFQEGLYMDDGNSKSHHSNEGPATMFSSMDEAYRESLSRSAYHAAQRHDTSFTQPASTSSHTYLDHDSMTQPDYLNQFHGVRGYDALSTDGSSNTAQQHQWQSTSAHHEPKYGRNPKDTFARVGHVPRLEMPVADVYNQSLEIPSPYTDSASFDGTTYLDHASPAATAFNLSRSNSTHSHQHHLEFVASQPPSPYPLDHPTFHGDQTTSHPHVNDNLNYAGNAAGLQSIDARNFAGLSHDMSSSMFNDAYHFSAPNIAINPPTPGIHGMHRNAMFPAYPFATDVPLITTTNAPQLHVTHVDAQLDSTGLIVDHAPRGRSHSDSGVLLLGDPRSESFSTTRRSSSSGSRSPSIARYGQTLAVRSSSHSRISKAEAQVRRASWSSTRDALERDFSPRDAQQVNMKQKNPATFICPVEGCNKAFTRAYNLRSHQRTHTNERPFLCEVCGKGFARQHDRKRHEKLHTNEKPFECPGCKKTFARMDALSRHFRSENGKMCIEGRPEYAHYLLEEGDDADEEEDEDDELSNT